MISHRHRQCHMFLYQPFCEILLTQKTKPHSCASLLCRTLNSHPSVPVHPVEVGTRLQVALCSHLRSTGSIILELFHQDPPLPQAHPRVEVRTLCRLWLPLLEEYTWTPSFWSTSLPVSCLRGWTPVRERTSCLMNTLRSFWAPVVWNFSVCQSGDKMT